MMILRSSPPSPFGRKVKIAARLLHLMDQITVQDADTTREDDSLRRQNPLGKIPTLVLANNIVLYDSRVIVEYLDHLAGGGRIIPQSAARYEVLTLQALADGVMDAALLQVYEARWRPEERRDARWVAHQAGKITRGLMALEAAPPPLAAMPDGLPDIGTITVACMLGYLDLRFHGAWRADHPRLVGWLDDFAAAVPAYALTAVHP